MQTAERVRYRKAISPRILVVRNRTCSEHKAQWQRRECQSSTRDAGWGAAAANGAGQPLAEATSPSGYANELSCASVVADSTMARDDSRKQTRRSAMEEFHWCGTGPRSLKDARGKEKSKQENEGRTRDNSSALDLPRSCGSFVGASGVQTQEVKATSCVNLVLALRTDAPKTNSSFLFSWTQLVHFSNSPEN